MGELVGGSVGAKVGQLVGELVWLEVGDTDGSANIEKSRAAFFFLNFSGCFWKLRNIFTNSDQTTA